MKKFFLTQIVFIMIWNYSDAQVKIIAHRGASYLAPENTVAAAKLAWKSNADAVECDIYLTKDNRVICSHDATTKRTTGSDLKISDMTSDILRTLDAGSFKGERFRGEKMPFLEELIKTVPRKKELVVEIKCGPEVLPFLEKMVTQTKRKIIFSFICFNFETITETKKVFSAYPCYWLCSGKELLELTLEKVPAAGLEGVSLHFSIIDEELMRKAKDIGLEVYSWTVDDPAEARRLISLGVKGITTNRPGWLNEQIF